MIDIVMALAEKYIVPDKKDDAKLIIDGIMKDGKISAGEIGTLITKLGPMLVEGGAEALKGVFERFTK